MTEIDIDRINRNPLYSTLGLRLTKISPEQAHSELTPSTKFCWPSPGQPHGGILATQLDTTMATAVLSLFDTITQVATIGLDVQYTSPALDGPYRCSAKVMRRGGRVSFVRAETVNASGELIALGSGSFRTFAPAPKPDTHSNS